MVKINREYLDPALLALNKHNNALVEKYKAQQHAVHSASQAVADRQQSKLISSRNLSRGWMIAIVLVGFGIMVALIAWSLPRLVGQLSNPVATIQPILSSSELKAEPSPTAVSGSSSDIVKDAPPPALIVPTYSREQGATGCIEGESFESPCTESVVLENGSTYNGTWSNGAANGEGEITFLDDGSVRGTWQDGALIEILEVSTPPSPTAVSGSSSDIVKDAPPPALIVPTYSREQGATGCIEGESFESPCTESVVLENGSTYNGTWSNGAANGEGEITFLDDGSVRGTWQDGALIEILEVSTPAASPTITSSVTLFTTKTVPDLSSKFKTVSVGHTFKSPSDPTWERAYCYILVLDRGEQVMVDLSTIENFNEKISLLDYKTNMKISRNEYKRAQEMCPYKYTNF